MKMNESRAQRQAFIIANTRIVTPFLCPEIHLRLITPDCRLWSATERDLAELPLAEPYWGFCWAGGQALARYVLDFPEVVAGKRVFVFGAGCGIDAIAAAKSGAGFVLASDIDPMAAEATQLNAGLNDVSVPVSTEDMKSSVLNGFDVVLAGDMFYDPLFSKEVFSWFKVLINEGLELFIGDPSRGNLNNQPLVTLATYQAPVDVDINGNYLQETTVFTLPQNAPRK